MSTCLVDVEHISRSVRLPNEHVPCIGMCVPRVACPWQRTLGYTWAPQGARSPRAACARGGARSRWRACPGARVPKRARPGMHWSAHAACCVHRMHAQAHALRALCASRLGVHAARIAPRVFCVLCSFCGVC